MAISKIILNGVTQMDVTNITATEVDVAQGKTFLLADGTIGAGTGSGGGSSVQSKTGSITGNGTINLSIPCDFEPDLIYIYGDMSASASYRGVISITILKDTFAYITNDSSTSNTNENLIYGEHGASGYGDSSQVSVTYSNGTLTLSTVTNSSARRFRSGQVYSYTLIKWT